MDKTEYEKLLLACALMGGPDVAREMLAVVQAPPLVTGEGPSLSTHRGDNRN